MKITRRQLRRLIKEAIGTPIQRIIADPLVDQKLKDMLASADKDAQKQALELIHDIYPQHAEEALKQSENIQLEREYRALGFKTLADEGIFPGSPGGEYEDMMGEGLGNIAAAFNQVTGRTDITPEDLMLLGQDDMSGPAWTAVGPESFDEILEYINWSSFEEDHVKLPGMGGDLTLIKNIMEDMSLSLIHI